MKILAILASALAAASFFSCSVKQAASPKSKTFVMNQGDTLWESLMETGLNASCRAQIISSLGKTMPMNRCKPGDSYEIEFSSPEGYRSFKYYPSGLDYYTVSYATFAVKAEKMTKKAKKKETGVRGSVKTSLWESMSAQGVSPELIVGFADIFAWQIDFLTEPRIGDTYRFIHESFEAEDGSVIYGDIYAAQYTASGEAYTAFLFTDGKGRRDYYSPEGKSLESAFLRAPLQFRRISSYFSRRRFHPILKYFRPHLGIDYAAPSGTPVSSIGEGTVTFAGRKGGFGNYAAVRHANGYASYYGHLQRFGRGVRPGVRVRQGQVIGYVGSTGLSSGPHLDFRMTKNGSFINFMKLKFPSASRIGDGDKEAFGRLKKEMFVKLAQIR